MIWILIPILYLVVGGWVYWKTTYEDETLSLAILVVLLWPLVVATIVHKIHSGQATATTRSGDKYRRINGKWERV